MEPLICVIKLAKTAKVYCSVYSKCNLTFSSMSTLATMNYRLSKPHTCVCTFTPTIAHLIRALLCYFFPPKAGWVSQFRDIFISRSKPRPHSQQICASQIHMYYSKGTAQSLLQKAVDKNANGSVLETPRQNRTTCRTKARLKRSTQDGAWFTLLYCILINRRAY